MAVERCGIQEGAVLFVRSLYSANALAVAGDSGTSPFTRLASGELQGSPESGLQFILVRGRVPEHLCTTLEPVDGLVRASADDLGVVLMRWSTRCWLRRLAARHRQRRAWRCIRGRGLSYPSRMPGARAGSEAGAAPPRAERGGVQGL